VIGGQGDTLTFRIGAARGALGSSPTPAVPFVIAPDNWIDVRFDARVIDLRVEYSGSGTFRLHGMSIEYDDSGRDEVTVPGPVQFVKNRAAARGVPAS